MDGLNHGIRTCAVFLLWAAAAIALPAQTLTTLHIFDRTDGAYPIAGLVQGSDGNLYGTTSSGGTNGNGTVFSITTGGALTTLHSFNGTDGNYPLASLTQSNGKFFGTTAEGGGKDGGTVFKITSTGTLKTLYNFCSQKNCTDGASPVGALVQGSHGKLYGTTTYGGTNDNGTIFSITSAGALTTVESFDDPGGYEPLAGLVQGIGQSFYGTTSEGGTNSDGTVFSITGGKLTTLYDFAGADGGYPAAGLVLGDDGNFYGTTEFGGANGYGTVFKITPGGSLTTLYSFCLKSACVDGAEPTAGLVLGSDGNFYGTTEDGNIDVCSGCGTVFSLSVGLDSFVKTNPTSGAVGAAVTILGTNLTGATTVTFNGTAAALAVKSKTEITTTVPTGATAGTVQIVTPGGTLSSNAPFRME